MNHPPGEWMLLGAVGIPFLVLKSYGAHAWLAFRKNRAPGAGMALDGVSVVVPMRGSEEGLSENLLSLLEQEGGGSPEVLFCVEDPADAAADVAREVLLQAPRARARLVISGPAGLELGKLHNLIAGVAAARGTTLVFLDSDVRLPSPSYLREFLAPLSRPDVGLVTCYPVYRGGRDPGALLIAGLINVDLWGTFVTRAAWGDGGFANGACMALRRETLERAGGLERLGRALLMDSRLARNVAQLGLRVAVHHEPVRICRERMSLSALWQQSSRWHVAMFRGLHPWTWLAFGWLRCTLVLALLFALLYPHSLAARGLLIGVLALRMGQAARMRGAGYRASSLVPRMLVQPIADLAGAAAWLLAMAQPTVRWRGRRYSVGRGAVLTPVPERGPSPARAGRRAIPGTGGSRFEQGPWSRGIAREWRADDR